MQNWHRHIRREDVEKATINIRLVDHSLPRVAVAKGGPVAPRLPRKNAYWQAQARQRGIAHVPTRLAQEFWVCLCKHAEKVMGWPVDWDRRGPPKKEGRKGPKLNPALKRPLLSRGVYRLDLLAFTPRKNRGLGDVLVPDLDSDACLPSTRDALQKVGIVDDDARIVANTSGVLQGDIALWIRLTPVEDVRAASAGPFARELGLVP